MILEEKIGQMILTGFRGTKLDIESAVAQNIRNGRISGVYLSDKDLALKQSIRNIESPQQITRLISDLQGLAKIPLFIGADQEGFGVNRLKKETGFEDFFDSCTDPLLCHSCAERMAAELKKTGVNIDFAPVVDLNINPDNPVIGKRGRSVSADPDVVTGYAEILIKALRNEGILPTLKHFPGHGSSSTDSHESFTDVSDSWSRDELIPYSRLIQSGQVEIIMSCHVLLKQYDDTYPASLSKKILTGLLREELGFTGLVFSDDLQMKAIADHYSLEQTVELAVNAGTDILLFSNNLPYDPEIAQKVLAIMLKLLDEGKISEDRINRSVKKILAVKEKQF